jgi:hypothetical protein
LLNNSVLDPHELAGQDVEGVNRTVVYDFGSEAAKNTANGATNELFFTAGPDNNFAGTFGRIVFKP